MCVFQKIFRGFASVVLAAALIGTIAGCGGSTNDQGTSLTLLGWYSAADLTKGLQGLASPLNELATEPATRAGSLSAFAGVQNNLTTQGVRIERVYYSYFIEGAPEQPPATSMAMSLMLGNSKAANATGGAVNPIGGSSLPGGIQALSNQAFAETMVVPPAVRQWILMNKNSLPETPFTMIVTAHVQGVTTAGDQLTTNPAELFVLFTPENPIPPGGGSGDATGTGGSTGSSNTETTNNAGEQTAQPTPANTGL